MEVTSTEAQNNFGQYLKFAQFGDIIVTKNGKPAAVIKQYPEAGPNQKSLVIAENAEAYNLNDVKVTYEEFIKFTHQSDNRYEYIDGVVYLLASSSFAHQNIIMEISNAMYQWFKGTKCRPLTAPFDVTLLKDGGKNVVQPDILVICDTENINEKGRYSGVPSLVLEVLSEATRNKDMLKKLDLYLHSGVREYWIVNPFNKEVYIYFYEEHAIKDYKVYKEGETAASIFFDGLKIPLGSIFAP